MNRRNFLRVGTMTGAASGILLAANAEHNEVIEPRLQIRVARPTDKLTEVVAFYRDGLGLPVIGHFESHSGYSGVMLGMPDERFHLEFTHADVGSPCPAPGRDNLLVFYMPDLPAYMATVKRMQAQGHTPVEPENPYWKDHSLTFEDPDGWRVVLYHGTAFERNVSQ